LFERQRFVDGGDILIADEEAVDEVEVVSADDSLFLFRFHHIRQ